LAIDEVVSGGLIMDLTPLSEEIPLHETLPCRKKETKEKGLLLPGTLILNIRPPKL
jgi:hypothetical protein